MKVKIFVEQDDVFLKDWRYLWLHSSYANYSNSPFVFLSALEAYSFKDFAIVAVYDDNGLAGVAPFVKRTQYGVGVYTVVPGEFVCGMPFLIKEKHVLRELLRRVFALGDVFLTNVPEQVMENFKSEIKGIEVLPDTINYFLNVKKSETGEVVVRNKRRLTRRAEEIERDLRLELFDGLNANALDLAFAIDNNSRKKTRGYNAFSETETRLFYKLLAKHFKERFVVGILYHKRKAVACQIGFTVGDVFYCSQIANISEYDRYSISRVLLIRLFEELGGHGIEMVDFGSGDDHVKRSFASGQHNLYTLVYSENFFIRNYLRSVFGLRKKVFGILMKHMSLYSFYRRFRSKLAFKFGEK
jgi:hypothetical protein